MATLLKQVAETSPMRQLALDILDCGLNALPPANHEYFEVADWQSAASDALEGDHSDLAWMLVRDRAYNEFREWQLADERNREFADFDTWLEQKARWNQPNWYEGAIVRRAVGRMGL